MNDDAKDFMFFANIYLLRVILMFSRHLSSSFPFARAQTKEISNIHAHANKKNI
jgi:hypothetical protein